VRSTAKDAPLGRSLRAGRSISKPDADASLRGEAVPIICRRGVFDVGESAAILAANIFFRLEAATLP
jgi:hypothetical protein